MLIDILAAESAVQSKNPQKVETLYQGVSHEKLMGPIRKVREADLNVQVSFLSTAYGILNGTAEIAPYSSSFEPYTKPELKAWAKKAHLKASFKNWLDTPATYKIIMLTEKGLAACLHDAVFQVEYPSWFLIHSKQSAAMKAVRGFYQTSKINQDVHRKFPKVESAYFTQYIVTEVLEYVAVAYNRENSLRNFINIQDPIDLLGEE